jgi:tetratricopeptide (TPR) repeat protein
MAVLFASLPVVGRLFLGLHGFDGAAGIACLCLLAGVYFHLRSRRFPAIPDSATLLDQANQLAASGRTDDAIALLREATTLSPRFWQAWQYRGELHLRQQNTNAAIEDFTTAITLAPSEPHLYALREEAYRILAEESSTRGDSATAAGLSGKDAQAPGDAMGRNTGSTA